MQVITLAAWAVHLAGKQSWWTSRMSGHERWSSHLAVVLSAILVPVWATQSLGGLEGMPASNSEVGWTSITVAGLHAAAVGLLLLQLRIPNGMRVLLVLASTWALPAIAEGNVLLALTAVSIPGGEELSTSAAPSGIDLAPILALLLAAWLLGHRPAPRP